MGRRRTKNSFLGISLVLMAFTAACSTQAKRVDCDWRLTPINKPAPKAPANAVTPNKTPKVSP